MRPWRSPSALTNETPGSAGGFAWVVWSDKSTCLRVKEAHSMTKPVARTRHGLNAVRNRIAIRGLAIVDRRGAPAKALFAWQNELVRDLGGADISTQKKTLVEMATRTRLYIDHVDAFLLTQPSLINKRKRAIIPILRERQQLVDSLARLLSQLGLEREAKRIPTLEEHLAQTYGDKKDLASADADAKEEVSGANTDDH